MTNYEIDKRVRKALDTIWFDLKSEISPLSCPWGCRFHKTSNDGTMTKGPSKWACSAPDGSYCELTGEISQGMVYQVLKTAHGSAN